MCRDLPECCWNGLFARLSRRDIWLSRETPWRVCTRQGDADTGRELQGEYNSEDEAWAVVRRLMNAEGPGKWKDLPSTTRGTSPEVG